MKKTSFLILVLIIIILLPINVKAEEKYEIYTKDDLINFSNEINNGNNFEGKTVYLMEDINLECNEENQWVPIGVPFTNKIFDGVFEGNGHTILGIYINNSDAQNIYYNALFGNNNGIIRNVGVFGYIKEGENARMSAGICAYNLGEITNCYSNVNIVTLGSINVGGIVAWNGTTNTYGYIKSCYNAGAITSLDDSVGGTVGIGGLVGYNYCGYIQDCYNVGKIESQRPDYIGNITGFSTSSPINCYYLNDISICEYEEAESKTDAEMKDKNFVNLLNRENMSFKFDENNINNGYPILYWKKDEKSIDNKVFLINITINIPQQKTNILKEKNLIFQK